MKVNKEAVDAIVEEINQIDIDKIELDAKALKYLKTVEAYLNCFDELQALYEEIDPSRKLADYDLLSNPNLLIQQVSKTGKPVENLAELYEAAKAVLPVFKAKIEDMLEQLKSMKESSSGVEFKLAPLKGKQRASEKAQDDYSEKVPGPPESWLYDIVRGSLLFDSAELLFQFLELLRADESIVFIKFKNRFCNPTLSGYRDFNMQIQITNNDEDGSKHICELQLHIRAIKEADTRLQSHAYYEFFRKYYAGAMDSLKGRMDDLRAICKGGSLDMAFLTGVVENPLEVDRMTRLADLFENYMNEYHLAIVITNAVKEMMEPHDWYMRMGDLLQRQGKLEEAMTLHKESLDIRLETLGSEHTKVADSYNKMAVVLDDQGKLEEAMTLYKKSLDIRVKELGPEHTDVAASYNNMAIVRKKQGNLEEAMALFKKALHIRVEALGPNHTKVANAYNNMANVLQNQGKLEEAMKLYKKAVDIRVKALGLDHTDVAQSYNNMATVLWKQGKLEEAMTLYKNAHDIYLKALGPDHTNVAGSYSNMALVLRNQGKLEEALTLYQKALDIRVIALGAEHTLVADSNNNMASVLCKQGKLEQAMELYKKALDIRMKALGADHTDVAQSYNNMATVLWKQGKLEEAMTLYKNAHDIYLKALGSSHTKVADSYNNMATVLQNQGKLEEAMDLYKKALDIYVKALGQEHTDVADSYNNMAAVLGKQGKLEEALTFVQNAKDIYLKAYGSDHTYTKMCDSRIAYIQRRLHVQARVKLPIAKE